MSFADVLNTQRICFGAFDLFLLTVGFTLTIFSVAWCKGRAKQREQRNPEHLDRLERLSNRLETNLNLSRRSDPTLHEERVSSEENLA